MTRDELNAELLKAGNTRRAEQPALSLEQVTNLLKCDTLIAIGRQLCDLEIVFANGLAEIAQAVKDSQHVGPKP